MGCARNEANFAHHIWDHPDADGHIGATACIVIPWFVDWLERHPRHDWRALAWFIHDHLPYSKMVFFATNAAVNLTWRSGEPQREIRRSRAPKGEKKILYKEGQPKREPSPERDYPGFPDPDDLGTWPLTPRSSPSGTPARPRREAGHQERARGLMIGLAVGNLLGVPQEGWARHAVEASYPEGVREIEVEPGEPDDDDLAQALILAEAAVETAPGDLDADRIGRRFWEWAEENGQRHRDSDLGRPGPDRRGHASLRPRGWTSGTGPDRPAGSRGGARGLGGVGPILRRQWRRHAVRSVGDSVDAG